MTICGNYSTMGIWLEKADITWKLVGNLLVGADLLCCVMLFFLVNIYKSTHMLSLLLILSFFSDLVHNFYLNLHILPFFFLFLSHPILLPFLLGEWRVSERLCGAELPAGLYHNKERACCSVMFCF